MWETISTIAVCLVIAAGVFFAVRSLRKSHKAGKCCGCSGACAGCSKCRDFDEELRKAGIK